MDRVEPQELSKTESGFIGEDSDALITMVEHLQNEGEQPTVDLASINHQSTHKSTGVPSRRHVQAVPPGQIFSKSQIELPNPVKLITNDFFKKKSKISNKLTVGDRLRGSKKLRPFIYIISVYYRRA